LLTDRRRALAFLLAGVIALGVCTGASAQALYDRFIQAVTLDKTEDVRAMLARGMDPNTVDPNGDPVLLVAARSGWEKTSAILLSGGAKVDAKNRFGDRPLMVAALNGHLAIVKLLFTRGAELNPPGWTPLIYAATNGHIEVMRYLIEAGADVNAESPNGTTALMMAVRGANADDAGRPRRRRQSSQRKRRDCARMGSARRLRRDRENAPPRRREELAVPREPSGRRPGRSSPRR